MEKWTPEKLMAVVRGFQPACVILAAADLDIFTIIEDGSVTAEAVAEKLEADFRAVTILLDALAAMELLTKQDKRYGLPRRIRQFLSQNSESNNIAALRHQANCLRRWVQLPQVVKSGKPAERLLNFHSEQDDTAAFIGAMNNFSAPMVSDVIDNLEPLDFHHLLDLGGALGTWTIEFLRRVPHAKATIFDLPEVVRMSKEHIARKGLSGRIKCIGGDFYTDDLPRGADFIWLSAIAHQNSRQQNSELFVKLYSTLEQGGRLVIRDVVMDDSHTTPVGGALFAVNMLVGTKGGGTYTFNEYRRDLEATGFSDITLVQRHDRMNSLISAVK